MAGLREPLVKPGSYGAPRSAESQFKRVLLRIEQRMDALEAMLEAQRQSAIDTAKLEARLNALERKKAPKRSKAKKYDPMDDKDETVVEPPFPGQG